VSGPSTACAECRALVGGYVLGALEPDEAAAVRRHITECPECATEHARLASLPDLLTLVSSEDSAAEHPPAALEEAVLDRFAREHRTDRGEGDRPARRTLRGRLAAPLRPLRRPLPAAVAGALTAAAAAAALVLFVGGGGAAEEGRVYAAKLSGTSAEAGARAHAKLTTSSSGTRVYLKVRGLRGNPDDLYELWCVKDDGTKISAGTFRVDARGEAAVNLTTAAVPGQYHRMAVERKPGEQVMVGSIQY
jgi:anti-sigma-K factor RskA